ncbi:MAG: 3-ketoacyl-ACP reductase [Alphaproteobacteria bacterium]|nr:3-ketoacyl-ACP reductase [Alphaproteobacteria bacterium]
MPNSARNPVALVTGGRRGIGAAIAQALSGRGFDVAVVDLERDEAAERTVATIKALGRRAIFAAGDIGDIASHGAVLDRVWTEFGTLDCLVNNAGVQVKTRGDLLDVTPASFDHLLGVNLRGTFFLTQAAAKRMTADSRGPDDPHRSIITLSSANAFMASINRGEYCISKAGLTMMNKLFALRLAAHHIHCYEVQPGVVETDMTAPAKETYDKAIANGVFPIARWGQPTDIAGAVATLATGAIPFSTGSAFPIDGGLHVQRL